MRAVLAIPLSLMLLVPALGEDTKPAEQAPTLTSRSELVLVPTLVRDKSGSPIAGLSKSDFALLENGAEQKIAVFEEIKTAAVPAKRATLPAGEFSNYLVGQPALRRITIIVMDSINTQFADRAYAREQILKFLQEMAGDNDPIALLWLNRGGIKVVHDFTTDPIVLAKALRRSKPAAETPFVDSEESLPDPTVLGESQQLASMMDNMEQNLLAAQRMLAVQLTLDGMQQIAKAYAAVPGRKSLIWASGGFPFSIDDMSRVLSGSAGLPSYLNDILPYYERTWQALNDANIALYPVDVRGLVVLGPSAGSRVSASNFGRVSQRAHLTHMDTLATFSEFAEMTGGQAYFNTNGLTHAFHDAVNDSASYYMLGFYLTQGDRRPGWRKLQVKVAHAGAHVRARSGFYVMPEEKSKDKARVSDIALALNSPLDFTSLPVLARWTEVAPDGDKKRAVFELVLPANAAIIDETDQNHMSIDFEAAVRAPEGKIVASHGRTVDAHLKPDAVAQIRASGITYKGDLDLPAGEYTVRFVVRDNLSGRMGSVAAPLRVP